MKHLLAIGAILLAMVGLAAGCGESPNHNGQDALFAKDMVPHHQQAVTMSDLALTQTTNRQVQDLAERIKTAQVSEISIMNGWLDAWGESTDHAGHAMAGKGMKGMVSAADLRTLESANGAEFDRLYLQRMTSHHKGGLEMTKIELDEGKYQPAKELAREITTNQEKEVAEMAKLLSAPAASAP